MLKFITLLISLSVSVALNAQNLFTENWESDYSNGSPIQGTNDWTGNANGGNIDVITVPSQPTNAPDLGSYYGYGAGSGVQPVVISNPANLSATGNYILEFDYGVNTEWDSFYAGFTSNLTNNNINGNMIAGLQISSPSGDIFFVSKLGGGAGATLAVDGTTLIGDWYRFRVTLDNDVDTYSVAYNAYDNSGQLTEWNDAATDIAAGSANISGIAFGGRSTVNNQFIDNITVAAIPESATFAVWLALSTLVYVGMRRIRKPVAGLMG